MKVLQLISGGDTGGAKTHVFALLGVLSKKIDVKLVCFTKGVFYDELSKTDVDCELIEQKNRFDMSVLKRLEEILACGYDVVHSHGARANFIVAQLKRRGMKLPCVTTIHSDYLLDFDGFYKRLLYTSLNVLSLKKLDYYIAVSSNFKDMLIKRNVRPNSIFTVYNGMNYNSDISFCEKEEFAKRIGIEYDKNCTYVGIIGRHDHVKGHDIFVRGAKEVLDKCSNVKFIIAGTGDGEQNLRKLAEELGISDNIIFCGFIDDIYSFINFIDINTLTSRCESFPYVLMEGARLKKPTVSSHVGGIDDLIIDKKTGLLFENEDPADFADKLICLINDRGTAQKYGEALYDWATENFSDENLAQTHVNIYNAIISDSKSPYRYDAVLSGYYGFNNIGDDALLYEIIKDLKKAGGDYLRIAVLSARPKNTKNRYRVDSTNRFSYSSVKKTLENSRMLINGGGSLIQDATSSKSLWYYIFVMKLAKRAGNKVFVYANGIGPLMKKNYGKAAQALENADYITLRDEMSFCEIKKLGIENPNIEVTFDPAVAVSPCSDAKVLKILKDEDIPDGKYFGISVREWSGNDNDFCAKVSGIIDYCNKKYNLIPVFIPMKYLDDIKFSEKILSGLNCKGYIIKNRYGFEETVGIIKNMQFIFGMRLHTLIFSTGVNVPTIGIIYDPKVKGFLDYIYKNSNYNFNVDASDINCEKAAGYIDCIFENYKDISENLSEIHDGMKALAYKNAEIAIELLNQKK